MQIGRTTAPSQWLEKLAILLMSLAVTLGVILIQPSFVEAAGFPGSDGIPQAPSDQASYESYLSSTGRPVMSRYNGYRANFATYQRDRLLVYGTPQQVPNNRYSPLYGEYAFLGFSFDETLVSNSDFPDDSSTGETYSSPWNWQERELGLLAEISWARLTARQQDMIRQSPIYYRRRSYGGMTYGGLGLTSQTSQVLALPSWHLGFALYTRHFLPGSSQIRYATMTGPGNGDIALRCEIELLNDLSAGDRLYIPDDADSIDLVYVIRGFIFDFSGLAQLADIATCGVGNEINWDSGSGAGPWSTTISQTIHRADLGSDLTEELTIRGQAWVVSYLGDIRLAEATRTITIIGEESPLEATLEVCGSLDFFANRHQAFDYQKSRDRHRYLGLEMLTFIAHFNRTPQSATIEFLDQTINLVTEPDKMDYEWSFTLPTDLQTLSWQHHRLQGSLVAQVTAEADIPIEPDPSESAGSSETEPTQSTEPQTRTIQAHAMISDIEITGDIHDIYRVLTG